MVCISYDQVSRISDVVSVGQKISLMCIGQDVRGNIKLSLKATLPGQKAEGRNGNSVPPVSEVSKTRHETPNSNTSPVDAGIGSEVNRASLTPSILIRSAEDCDEEEKKSAGLNLKLKNTRKLNDMSKSFTQNGVNMKEVEVERPPITARTLKLGMKVRAKVYQIRTGGLVLNLGEGLRGMYRFEVHNHFPLF